MLVLVVGNDIAGETDSTDNLPEGFQVFEVEIRQLNDLYFDGKTVSVIHGYKPSGRCRAISRWTELITQHYGLQALSSKKSAKN